MDKDLMLKNNQNQKIISYITNIDLYNLTEEQQINLKDALVKKVKISELDKIIKNIVLDLSRVGEPSFGADLKYIADDNQKRLELIYGLLDNFEQFKSRINNYKRNKNNCNENMEGIFEFLLKTQDFFNTLLKHSEFKKQEYFENQMFLEKNKQKFLNPSEEDDEDLSL